MRSIKDRATEAVVAFLAQEGDRILSECENEREYEHDTRNLYDSYGYGVYAGGRLVRSGYLDAEPMADRTRKWYGKSVSGREQIRHFLESEYKSGGGIELVIAAAMPYARVLENASSGQTRKYRVVSMSYEKLKEVAAKIGGAGVARIIGGRASV